MQLKLYEQSRFSQPAPFKVGQIVYEARAEHKTPARIIEIIKSHGLTYYRVHFKYKSILKKVILPGYRLKA